VTEAPTVTVLYERKLSDGNYGSEGLSMAITSSFAQGQPAKDVLLAFARDIRRLVLSELAQSAAPRVARAAAEELNPGSRKQPVRAGNDSEDLEDLPF
jgi:hypothetical protein